MTHYGYFLMIDFFPYYQVTVFQQPHYLQNFVQSTFNALPAEEVKGATIVVSGDGRYFSKDAVQVI